MPRKNKKRQRKDERRRTMQRVRQEKGWQPPPDVEFLDDELTRDLLSFVPDVAGDPARGEAASDALVVAVLESEDLADEPEFRELYFHPMQAIDIYAELEEERGISEEALNALSPEEEDDLFFDLMEDLVRRALTDQMQDDILDAVEAAWRRVRQEGDQEMAGRLAGMLTLLRSKESEEAWPQVGLVQAILHRSLEAGFELMGVLEPEGATNQSARDRWQRGTDRRVQQQLEAIITKYPGLAVVLAQDDDQAWQEGLRALMEGELYIGFFSEEELERAADLLSPEALGGPELSEEEMGRAGIQVLRTYLAGLLTLERRAEMREQLLALLEDEELAGEHAQLLTTMLYDLEDTDADDVIVALTAAMFGELEDMAEDVLGDQDDEAED
jgi:hypothetical protein